MGTGLVFGFRSCQQMNTAEDKAAEKFHELFQTPDSEIRKEIWAEKDKAESNFYKNQKLFFGCAFLTIAGAGLAHIPQRRRGGLGPAYR